MVGLLVRRLGRNVTVCHSLEACILVVNICWLGVLIFVTGRVLSFGVKVSVVGEVFGGAGYEHRFIACPSLSHNVHNMFRPS